MGGLTLAHEAMMNWPDTVFLLGVWFGFVAVLVAIFR